MEKYLRPAGSKRIKLAGLILIISILIEDVPAIKLHSSVSSFGPDQGNDALDEEAIDIMAFTENLTADKNKKIKTQDVEQNRKRVAKQQGSADDMRMSEDQAVAAYQSQVMAENEISEEDKKEEKPKKTVKKAPAKKVEKEENTEQVEEEVVEEKAEDVPDSTTVISNGQELTSTVDVSSITRDAEKTVKKRVVKKAKKQEEDKQQPEKSEQTKKKEDDLPEADIDMSNIEQKSDNVNKNTEATQSVDEAQAAIDSQPEDKEQKSGLEQIAENYAASQKEEQKLQQSQKKTIKVKTSSESTELEPALGEVIAERDNLENDYKKAVKDDKEKQQKKEQKLAEEELNASPWGQMDTTLQFSKALLTKAQGFEEADPVVQLECDKIEKPPPKVYTKEEIEKKEQEKMKLFSEFVAADAEANVPVIKKKEVKLEDQPLHFKYYANDNDGENQVTDELTDEILGAQSDQINKNKKVMKYDNSDYAEVGVTPLKPVDYSKSQLNVNNLMEPLHNQDLTEIEENEQESQKMKQGSKSKTKDEPVIELTTS